MDRIYHTLPLEMIGEALILRISAIQPIGVQFAMPDELHVTTEPVMPSTSKALWGYPPLHNHAMVLC